MPPLARAEAAIRHGLRYSRIGSIGPPEGGLRRFDIGNGAEELGRGRDGGVRRHLRRDEAAQRLTPVLLVRRVLARGRAMIVAGMLGMNGRAVVRVVEELMRAGGRHDDRSSRRDRHSN